MAGPAALTTVPNVNAWVGENDSLANKDLIWRQILRVSDVVMRWLSRSSLTKQVNTEVYNGVGGSNMLLRQFPVISVASLGIDNSVVQACQQPPLGQGFLLESWGGLPPGKCQQLALNGYTFSRGFQNVSVTYTSGYVVVGEAQTVSASGAPPTVTPLSRWGLWCEDDGVTYANGTPMVAVASSPGIGQYVPPNPFSLNNPTNQYAFSVADEGAAILISYSYIPSAIEGAVCEQVSERLAYRGRIGMSSKSLASQETVSFSLKDMSDYVKMSLQDYRNINIF